MTLTARQEACRPCGLRGLCGVWGRALLHLCINVPREHVVQLVGRQEPAILHARSCSGCYSEVDPAWRVCPICGTVLNESTTRVTRLTMSIVFWLIP
jgi:hypothetical protein